METIRSGQRGAVLMTTKTSNILDQYSDLLSLMADGRERTAIDVAIKLGIQDREAAYYLNELTQKGIISRTQITHIPVWRMKKAK